MVEMSLTKALSVKTATEKRAVLAVLPDDDKLEEKVLAAFEGASKTWRQRLTSMIGTDKARVVFHELDRERGNLMDRSVAI